MTATDSGRYPSLRALTEAHAELLRLLAAEKDETALSEEFVRQVEMFLKRAAATGAVLDFSEDRSEAQSYVNYWTSALLTSDLSARALTLDPFDPKQLAPSGTKGSPYQGFRAFQTVDASVFFGRRSLIDKLVSELAEHHFVAVVGISGSGKSSLVRAGLIPALKEGGLPGSAQWKYLNPIKPGPHPLESLAEAMLQASSRGTKESIVRGLADSRNFLADFVRAEKAPVVLTVDQFEELFTLGAPAAEWEAFAQNVADAVTLADGKLYVVATMRSEYTMVVAKSEALRLLFERGQFSVPPLRSPELRETIERPALRVGVRFEQGLVDQLIQSVLGEPAGLPLLEFALLKLWENRTNDTITRASYEALGGSPEKILAKTADGLYESLKDDPVDQEAFRQIFLNLIQLGEGLRIARRPASRESLRSLTDPDRADRLIALLEKEGFVQVHPGSVPEEDQIDITHEALTQKWEMLQTWMEGDLAVLRQKKLLKENARAYNEDRSRVTLYSGRQLEDALRLKTSDPIETRFLEDSSKAESRFNAERKRAERSWKWFKRGILVAALVGAAALGGGWRARSSFKTLATKQDELTKANQKLKQQTDQLETLKARFTESASAVQKLLPDKAAVEAAFTNDPSMAQNTPRIYVQYLDQGDESLAKQLVKTLRDLAYIAPGAQYVPPERVKGFTGNELRYFHKNSTESGDAAKIADQLKGLAPIVPQFVSGFEQNPKVPARQYEIWIGSSVNPNVK
jgi:energy-coupling factor transporter ATP-binding protein EcfA2